MSRKPCGRSILAGFGRPVNPVDDVESCGYHRMAGKQQCVWHWLLKQPAGLQASWAKARLAQTLDADRRARVPAEHWPRGERWCAGCQSFVPLFYTSGSRCKSCASTASHGQAIERQYGLSGEDYEALLRFQGGRCYICRRKPVTKRLAVDHDHRNGVVRGLLCANNENGCNRAVVANLEAAHDGGLAAARRTVEYLERPPYARMKGVGAVDPVVDSADPPSGYALAPPF